jgi:hypothetical protein
MGARLVVGSAGGAQKCAWLTDECGFDSAIDYRSADVRAALGDAFPDGIDLFFDNVGGWQFVYGLHTMAIHGRISMCGAVSNFGTKDQPSMAELIEAVLRRVTIRGFIVRDFEALRPEFEERVSGWLASGELVDRATVFEGIENAGAGLEGLLNGANVGKALIRLSD